ncbi:MAG: PD-(D/E)XK nuclease family protein [Thermodesulfobacteriota bacterium]
MDQWVFPTTESLQAKVIAETDEKTLILTSGGRLARQLRHAFRWNQMTTGRSGWLFPKILSLNAWLQETWRHSWPEEALASTLTLFRLWEKTVNRFDLPEGLPADLRLFQSLDETFRVRIRDKVPWPSNEYASPIIAWRGELFREFEKNLARQGYLHPAVLPLKILEQKTFSSLNPSQKIFLLGFEFPAPVEADLLNVLQKKFGAVFCSTSPSPEPELKAVSLPTEEEEVVWLAEQILLETRHHPLHRIGLVVPNLSLYGPLIASAFRDLMGPSVEEEEGRYNISLGRSLWDQPLVQAGLLPLRFSLEGEPRALLFSLLQSPYYKRWAGRSVQLARADLLWRTQGIDSGLEGLLQCLIHHNFLALSGDDVSETPLASLLYPLGRPRQSVPQWVESICRCWKDLGYPVISLPGEEGSYNHLEEILNQMAVELKDEIMDGLRFFSWLKTLAGQTLVNDPGHEQAGIQVLGLIEARGLAFDRLFLAGLSKGSLPQPVRPFPFLSPEERRFVQGATIQSQYDFSRKAFSHLLTLSPRITLTRAEEENGDPVPPSPFWPEHYEKGERNFWIRPGQVWPRAEWLRQTLEGIPDFPVPHPPSDIVGPSFPAKALSRQSPLQRARVEKDPPPLTGISVTAVETLLACPFQFFCANLLGIVPLEEISAGISSLEKGNTLHRILALITRTLRAEGVSLTDRPAVEQRVRHCIQEVLKDKAHQPHWLVEEVRLVGEEEGLGGLLGRWLELERERWEKGWRWEKEEIPFSGLRLPDWSFSIKGRIDRVDSNESLEEACCWDYKTGRLPSPGEISKNFLAPQLPLYLLALKSLPDLRSKFVKVRQAGFVALKSEGELALKQPLPQSGDWETCLADWEEAIRLAGEKILKGEYPPAPKPEPRGKNQGACTYCPYRCLCAYWKV